MDTAIRDKPDTTTAKGLGAPVFRDDEQNLRLLVESVTDHSLYVLNIDGTVAALVPTRFPVGALGHWAGFLGNPDARPMVERPGHIWVELGMRGPNEMALAVSDDGVGIPASFDVHTATSLGMQLVTTLSEQLDGRLEVIRGTGTTVRVTFSVAAQ